MALSHLVKVGGLLGLAFGSIACSTASQANSGKIIPTAPPPQDAAIAQKAVPYSVANFQPLDKHRIITKPNQPTEIHLNTVVILAVVYEEAAVPATPTPYGGEVLVWIQLSPSRSATLSVPPFDHQVVITTASYAWDGITPVDAVTAKGFLADFILELKSPLHCENRGCRHGIASIVSPDLVPGPKFELFSSIAP